MSDAENENDLNALSTVLNRVKPTVVVRRRVYEVAKVEQAAVFVDAPSEDDEDGPPSSVNVARALASLRGDELRRLEEILEADEAEDEAVAAPTEEIPAARMLKVGESITVPELAKRMGVKTEELVTTLVAGGFFSTTRKSVLTRANAAAAAWMFGWIVEPE